MSNYPKTKWAIAEQILASFLMNMYIIVSFLKLSTNSY